MLNLRIGNNVMIRGTGSKWDGTISPIVSINPQEKSCDVIVPDGTVLTFTRDFLVTIETVEKPKVRENSVRFILEN